MGTSVAFYLMIRLMVTAKRTFKAFALLVGLEEWYH